MPHEFKGPAFPHEPSHSELLSYIRNTHDQVQALRGEVLNLRDLTDILAAELTHLCSTIDAKTLYEPQENRPESSRPLSVTNPVDECQQNVTNAAAERQHIVDPIT